VSQAGFVIVGHCRVVLGTTTEKMGQVSGRIVSDRVGSCQEWGGGGGGGGGGGSEWW